VAGDRRRCGLVVVVGAGALAGAMLWWTWADWSGYTKRKAMERDDQRKLERINRHREALGQKPKNATPPRRR
jgi:small Trp-rich protein